jgi:rSAM-associated Gly-rich repeat protein
VLLGSAASGAASQQPAPTAPSAPQGDRVSERLAAIREAVSAVAGGPTDPADAASEQRLAWGNWHNGGGGFGFGSPWGNFGFGVPWNNWNNWRNGWHNWRNGWGNW